MSTTPGGEKASRARPSAVGWAGSVAAGLNDVTGPWPGLLLDVGDLELLQHAQPGPAAGGGGEVLQHAGRALLERGGAVGAARHHAQRQPRAVEPVRRALQQPPRGELGREAVGGGDGQACQPRDLGEAVLTALRERHQDRSDLARDRSAGFGRVACHGAAPPTSSCDLRVGQENTAPAWLTSASFRRQHPQCASSPWFPRVVARETRGLHRGERERPGQDLRVELDWLETFLAVADRGGFTAASATVHRSQSRVSAHIAALERDLGVRLIDRTHRPARLTAAGEVFARHAREVVAGVGAARSAVGALRGMDAEPITVLTTPCIGAAFFPVILAELAQTHPGMRVSLVERAGLDLERRLLGRRPRRSPSSRAARHAAAAGSARAPALAGAAAGRRARLRRAGSRRRSRVARRARGPTVDRRRRGGRASSSRRRARAEVLGQLAARGRAVQPRAIVDTPADHDRAGAGGRRRRCRQRGCARPPRPLRPRRPRHRRTRRCAGTSSGTGTTRSPRRRRAWSCSAPSSTLRRRPARQPSGGVGSDDLVRPRGGWGSARPCRRWRPS